MGIHETYTKRLLHALYVGRFDDSDAVICDDPAVGAAGVKIDGVIDSRIAVEIESGTAKVVAADADRLVRHPLPFKLLVIVPVNQQNPETARQRTIRNMSSHLNASQFRVVVLQGTGLYPQTGADLDQLRSELLDWPPAELSG
jgi:hypothetical protein